MPDESVDIYIRFRDHVTRGVRQVTGRLKEMGPAGRAAALTMNAGLRAVRQNAERIAHTFERVRAAAGRMASSTIQHLQRLGQRLMQTAKWAVLAGAAFVGWQIKGGVGGLSQIEDYQATLEIVTKSSAKARQIIRDALKFSESTPFEPRPVIEAATQLTVYGLSYTKWLRSAGELAAAFKVDLGEVTGALGRLKAGQSGEAFERLRTMGITKTKLEVEGVQFSKGGQLLTDTETTMNAVKRIIDRDFGGTLAKQAKNFSGLWSTIKGKWDLLRQAMAQPLFDRLKADFARIIGLWDKWQPGEMGQRLVRTIGDALGSAYDSVRDYATRMAKVFQSGGIVGVWDELRPQLEAAVGKVFRALGTAAKEAFLMPFKL
ncbi:hypothetical protein KKC06_06675, partial [Patescibacteria group bacterium]|nr:hypothetical protein [Patescibacteria group bacterium]